MTISLSLLDLRGENADENPIPLAEIVSILMEHGCDVPEIRQGFNSVGLPGEKYHTASLYVKNGSIIEFGLDHLNHGEQTLALLFSLISKLKLVMIPSCGGVLYALNDVFTEIPKYIRDQFPEFVAVTKPEDCR